jgi:hypothetical protein
LISLFLSLLLSFFTLKRFNHNSEERKQKDIERLKAISERNFLYKLFFRASLYKNNRVTNILFFFLFNLAMPLVGYVFSLWIALYLRNVKYQKKVTNTNILNLDEFGTSFLKVERIFGEGSMSELMNSEYAPRSKKLKALSSLSGSLSPANLRIIRTTLSSKDDEIRMFGYSTINKAEKALNTKINLHLEVFNEEQEKEEQEQDKERMAEAAKELAMLYWELVYTELSHESLKADFLKEVKKYVKAAKSYYKPKTDEIENKIAVLNEKLTLLKASRSVKEMKVEIKEYKDKLIKSIDTVTKLYVLMGKVYMNENDYENASTEFTIAQELHEERSSFILPYLAEIQFLLGNYTAVNSIINRSPDLSLNATLHPIIEQWKIS